MLLRTQTLNFTKIHESLSTNILLLDGTTLDYGGSETHYFTLFLKLEVFILKQIYAYLCAHLKINLMHVIYACDFHSFIHVHQLT